MINKLIFLLFFLICNEFVFSQKKVNIFDSSSVKNFIHNVGISEQIRTVQSNLKQFVSNRGYSNLILINICKVTKTKIFLSIINGKMKTPERRLMEELDEQMEAIKKKISISKDLTTF